MNTYHLISKLGKLFPKKIASPGDYVGLMCGQFKKETNHILICLDFDWEVFAVVREMEQKPDLIITHHPFLFGTRNFVFKHDQEKKELCEIMEKMDIPIFSVHTNFDTGYRGMNDALMKALGLYNVVPDENDKMMRVGYLKEPMFIDDFAQYAKNRFGVSYGLLIKEGKSYIKKVSIVGGGGSRGWKLAKDNGSDIYISGDAPHHVRRDIVNAHFNYLDLPHEIEKIFMNQMKTILLELDNTLVITTIDHEKEPFVV